MPFSGVQDARECDHSNSNEYEYEILFINTGVKSATTTILLIPLLLDSFYHSRVKSVTTNTATIERSYYPGGKKCNY